MYELHVKKHSKINDISMNNNDATRLLHQIVEAISK